MKGAFDANLPRTKPLTRQKATTLEQPPLGAQPTEKDIAALAHSGLPLDSSFDPDVAAQKLVTHMKSRVRKGRPKARPTERTTAATPLAGQVLATPTLKSDALRSVLPGQTAVEALLTEGSAESASPLAPDAQKISQPTTGAPPPPMVRPAATTPQPPLTRRSAPSGTTTVNLPGAEVLTQGRARIEQLRDRLTATSRTGIAQTSTEPWATAEATRQAVDSFRARVNSVLRERDALNEALQLVRAELDQAKQELATTNQALAAAETLANDRIQLANTLMGEVEVLADERDQALVRISELKGLDEQQMRLLSEAEVAIEKRDEQLLNMQKIEAEVRAALQLRSEEFERLTARLAERTAERDLLMDRITRLETEVRALNDSRGALVEIKRVLDSARV